MLFRSRVDQYERDREVRLENDVHAREYRLAKLRKAEAEFYAHAEVKYLVKSYQSDDYIELTPGLISSYNFVYGWFPADFESKKRIYETAKSDLQKAIDARNRRHETVKDKLNLILTVLEGDAVPTATLMKVSQDILATKASVCPEPSIAKEKESLESGLA